MNQKLNELSSSLKIKIAGVENKFNELRTHVSDASEKTSAAIDTKLASVRADIASQKQKIEEAKNKLEARTEAKKAEIEASFHEWKKNKNIERLEAVADDAEDYAMAGLIYAAAATQDAEAAVLEALRARTAADQAAQPSI